MRKGGREETIGAERRGGGGSRGFSRMNTHLKDTRVLQRKEEAARVTSFTQFGRSCVLDESPLGEKYRLENETRVLTGLAL